MNENIPVWVQNFLWVSLIIAMILFLIIIILSIVGIGKMLFEKENEEDEE